MPTIVAKSLPSGSLGISFTKSRPSSYAEDFVKFGRWLLENNARGHIPQDLIEKNALGPATDSLGKSMRVNLRTFGWSNVGDRGRSARNMPRMRPQSFLTQAGWDMFGVLSEMQQAQASGDRGRLLTLEQVKQTLVRTAYMELNEQCLATIFSSRDAAEIERAKSQLMVVETLRFLSRHPEISKDETFLIYHVLSQFDMEHRSRKAFDEEVDAVLDGYLAGSVQLTNTERKPWPGYILGCLEWTGFAQNYRSQSHVLQRPDTRKELMAFVNQLGDWNGKALFDSAKPDPVEEALLAGMDHDDGSGHVYAFVNPAWPGWIKVGMSVDWEARLESYQTGAPNRDYTVLAVSSRTADRALAERKMHDFLENHPLCSERISEWFRVDEALVKQEISDIA